MTSSVVWGIMAYSAACYGLTVAIIYANIWLDILKGKINAYYIHWRRRGADRSDEAS